VFALADFGNWAGRQPILLEPESLRGDSAPSRKAREEVAGTITKCSFSGGAGGRPEGAAVGHFQPFSIMPMNSGKDYKARETDIAQPIMAGGPVGGNQGGDFIVQPVAFQQVADCLTAAYGTKWNGNASATNGSLFAAQPIALQDASSREKKQDGKGWRDDGTMYTLDTTGLQGVAQPISFSAQMSVPQVDFDLNATLQAKNPMAVAQPQPMCFQQNTRDEVRYIGGDGQIAGALAAEAGMKQQNYIQTANQPVIAAFKGGQGSGAGGIGYSEHVAPTLPASDGGNRTPTLLNAMAVRRLTPVECERLQGFPDGYTDIPWRGKPDSPDAPRYKAMGNSMAVPVMAWIGKRIQKVEDGLL